MGLCFGDQKIILRASARALRGASRILIALSMTITEFTGPAPPDAEVFHGTAELIADRQ